MEEKKRGFFNQIQKLDAAYNKMLKFFTCLIHH